MKRRYVGLVLQCALVFGCATGARSPDLCGYWQSKVDPTMSLHGQPVELPSDNHALDAIQCLLKTRGRTGQGRFGGATRLEATVDHDDPIASVELNALYYIDYIYHRKWNHADVVVLVGPHGRNSQQTVDEAFGHYLAWFALTTRIGLERARAEGLHPLRDTELRWQ